MQKHEGVELKKKFKGTGREMGEIADLLGMTRQNLSYHLRKPKLEDNFKRLVSEKGKQIFHVEQFEVTGEAGALVGEITEEIISIKGDLKVLLSMVLELYAASKGSSYATQEREFLKNSKAVTDRLYDERKKKS